MEREHEHAADLVHFQATIAYGYRLGRRSSRDTFCELFNLKTLCKLSCEWARRQIAPEDENGWKALLRRED